MKIKEVTMYTCDYCVKRLIRKHAMIKHEDNCTKNPKNIPACFDCELCAEEPIEYYVMTDQNDPDGFEAVKSSCLKCLKTDQLMYSPKAKRFAEKYTEDFEDQIPCPKKCKDQKPYTAFEVDGFDWSFGLNKKEGDSNGNI